jgi:hypothetical protein
VGLPIMDFDDQFELEHLFLTERNCRVCGRTKDLLDGFYLTRKGRGDIPSAYSYECKICTIIRIKSARKLKPVTNKWEYPDW